jgi:hypothetical protein
MNPVTINTTTFTLKQGLTLIDGTVSSTATGATFHPTSNLAANTLYTATITTGVEDDKGLSLASDKIWNFTTGTLLAAGPAAVNLGTADNFAILSKSGITNITLSAVTGNMGVSPASGTYITGFTCADVVAPSIVYSVGPLAPGFESCTSQAVIAESALTTAIGDMQTAYTDAAGRPLPDFTELGAGDISGLTLAPGLYKWGTGVSINTDVTLNGSAEDVWIFQIASDLTMASATNVLVTGGASASNIFWQVAGRTYIDTSATINGNILCQTQINMLTGATLNGRALAQTQVTLDQNTVTKP